MSGNGDKKLELLKMYMEAHDNRPGCDYKFKGFRHYFSERVVKELIQVKPHHQRFFTDAIPDMLLKGIESGHSKERIVQAFEYLELYCLNLIHYYWKPEIIRLKRYTGIYRTKLLDVLPNVDRFITDIGYQRQQDADVFHLKKYVSRSLLSQLALDCFVAQMLCQYVENVTKLVQRQNPNIRWTEIARVIDQLEGEERSCAELAWGLTDVNVNGTEPEQPASLMILTQNNMDEDDDMYG